MEAKLLVYLFFASLSCTSLGRISLDPLLYKQPLSTNPNDIHFFFYPINGVPQREQEIIFKDTASLTSTTFNPHVKTVFLIHGYTDNRTTHLNAVVLPVYLASPLKYNYIVVDWSFLSGNTQSSPNYFKVVSTSIPIVAQRTQQFLQFLNIDPLTVHIVGHSLGAHVAGMVGFLYQNSNNGKQLARITGLDPAGPLYLFPVPFHKLYKTDAAFVDVIHTNVGQYGDTSIDGHVDFYANGGISQPGCALVTDLDFSTTCSHQFVTFLYAASIMKDFPAYPCVLVNALGVMAYLTGLELEVCLLHASVLLGEKCPTTARGLYSLQTSAALSDRELLILENVNGTSGLDKQ